MRKLKISIAVFAAAIAWGGPSYGQQTRAQMNSFNNTNITTNGAGAITGAIVNNMNSQIINSSDILKDRPNNFNVVTLGANQGSQALTDQAFQSAFTQAAATNGSVEIPCASYTLTQNISVTENQSGALAINGAGHECVTLNFVGSNGITITKADQFGSVFAHDFTMTTTDTTGTFKALSISNPTPVVYGASTGFGQDVIRNVFYRGADTYSTGQAYWGVGLALSNDSYISVDAGGYWGALQSGVYKGTAVSYAGLVSPASYAVVLNLNSFQVQTCDTGLLYGDYVQGVTITGGSNFTNCNKGVDTLATYVGIPDQLVVADSQFATFGVAINAKLIPALLVHDNDIIILGGTGVVFGQLGYVIHHNFVHSIGGSALGVGLNETYGSFVGGTVDHNTIYAMVTGIEVTAVAATLPTPDVAVTLIDNNTMSSNTDNYLVSDPAITGVTIHHPGALTAAGALGGAHPVIPACANNISGLTFTVIDQTTTTFGAPVTSTSGGGFGANNWGTALCGSSGYTFH